MNPPVPKGEDRQPIRARILALMLDRAWWTDHELATRLGVLTNTIGSKRRELREQKHGGCVFEERRSQKPFNPRGREFRLVQP